MPRDKVVAPRGRVRLHRVHMPPPLVIRTGRSIGKSTSLIAAGIAALKNLNEDMDAKAKGLLPGWRPITGWQHNDVLYEWGAIIGNLLMRKGLNYGISGMYVEFANVANPGDTVSPPVITRSADDGVTYYNALSHSATNDYLRVPVLAGALGSTDSVNFPKGNAPKFFAQTSGVAGVHGKPFSDTHNSIVIGAALVAFVDETDATQDLVFSRYYADPSEQMPKLPTSQVGVEWNLILE